MKYLSVNEVAFLATKIAADMNLRVPSIKEIRKLLTKQRAFPQYYTDGTLQLWVDMFYIAQSSIYDRDVHYVYLTDRHIDEERQSYQTARHLRKNKVMLPQNIEAQFRDGQSRMMLEEINFVISEKYVVNDSKL
jgi:hypothetical protein